LPANVYETFLTVTVLLIHSFQDLSNKYPNAFPNPVIDGMVEFEWDLYIDAKRKVSYLLSVFI